MTGIVINLNHPVVKQNIKNLAGLMTCLFGLMELSSLFFKINKENNNSTIFLFFSRISIFLSPLTTSFGLWLILNLSLLFPFQIESFFGKNTIFAINPWSPKHVVSIMAVCFALPALFASFKCWLYRKVTNPIVSSWILFVLLFNTLTSRPVLHLMNQLALYLFT